MTYKVVLKKNAEKYYLKTDKKQTKKLDVAFSDMEENPRGINSKKLKGVLTGLWRYRVGSLRLIYEIIDSEKQVNVILILPRGDVYKKGEI